MEQKRKRKFGDRKEGRWLKNLAPLYSLVPYIMRTRDDSQNYFSDTIDIAEAERFLRKKRAEGYPGMGMLHLFAAAYVRTISQRPALNRFVSGSRIYARNNIEFVISIKKEMRSDSNETCIKVVFDPHDTINEIYTKLNAEIDKVRVNSEDTGTDTVAAAFMKLPRLVIRLGIQLVYLLDFFGLLPQKILDASPFHGSFIISDLGSLGIPPIYHHIYNIGNLPVFLCFGAKRRELAMNTDGTVYEKKVIDYRVVTDERICDGFYYAQAFKYMKSYLRHPEVLDVPPEEVFEDID